LPNGFIEDRLKEHLGDFVQTSGFNVPPHRSLAFRPPDAGQQMGFETKRPEIG
jgi:hypothetical protein